MPNASQALYTDDKSFTCKPSADVTAKRFVKISANGTNGLPKVAHATQNDDVVGVSALTVTAASGDTVPVHRKSAGIVEVEAGANLSAGGFVQPDANGKAIVYVPPTIDVTLGSAQNVPTKRPAGRVVFDATSGGTAFIDLNV